MMKLFDLLKLKSLELNRKLLLKLKKKHVSQLRLLLRQLLKRKHDKRPLLSWLLRRKRRDFRNLRMIELKQKLPRRKKSDWRL